jgi:superfamily II DNA or RNA helicase
MDYHTFINSKRHKTGQFGFEPNWMPDMAFDYQRHVITQALEKGRKAIFADTGMGKTLMQLTIAQNIVNHTGGAVLSLHLWLLLFSS